MSALQDSRRMLNLAAAFLNNDPCALRQEAVQELAAACALTVEEAYLPMLASYFGLNLDDPEDMRLYRACFLRMVQRLDPALVTEDPYVRAMGFPAAKEGAISLEKMHYAPMELFVRDDFLRTEEGLVLPRLGWFDAPVPYPALTEHGRIWMTVTPNEINTIRPCAEKCRGRVLAYGLGLGYFAFHALMEKDVESVTVVEKSPEVIALFQRWLLPRFPRKEQLRIVQADAFDYAAREAPQGGYDVVFTDLWHDVSDGLPLYQQMKQLEFPGPEFLYWIEPTLRCYLEDV